MSERGRLSTLQSEVLDAFFGAEREFFLSGGGALVGFHLRHRETTDLDLFTVSAEAFERARLVRVVVQRGSEQLVVDLVRDIGPQLHPKTTIDGIVVDPIEEIFSNKLTTLVSRQELRDLIDVLELERRGLRVESFLHEALAKDGGCTPATLAYLLNEWEIPSNAKLPPGYTVDELRVFKSALAERLLIASHPGSR